ncbi:MULTISPECIES: hypothetical protein [Ruminococcus]|uniref:Uncharacterized protein n=1 Tax=Ruminococcus flavefaciens TaxID=1265 RepID=A0A1M7HEX2_RUMFL|nr:MULTISPECIES: hypothetical protein [Ruminococcus]MCR4794866.1 hypothetical protein [Ruminococcus sp.]SHM27019.1 hypothetical protein SAMN04487860_102314 [Ruminococcus flavefaciens]
MQNKTAKIITALISATFSLCIIFSECFTAYAADGSEKAKISKGMTIFIMVSVFVVTAIITGVISFRVRRNKLRQSSENKSSEENKE